MLRYWIKKRRWSPQFLYMTRYNIPRSCLLLSIIVIEEFCLDGSFAATANRKYVNSSMTRAKILPVYSMHAKVSEKIIGVWFNARYYARGGDAGRRGNIEQKFAKIYPCTVHRPSLSRLNSRFFFITFYNIRNRRKIVSRHVAFIRIAHVHVYNVVATHCKYIYFFSNKRDISGCFCFYRNYRDIHGIDCYKVLLQIFLTAQQPQQQLQFFKYACN